MERTDDCRSGLHCVDHVCSTLQECVEICDRAEECDISFREDEPFSYNGCLAQCGSTVAGWGQDPLEAFVACFTDDHTCEQLQAADYAPQMCYNELELPSDREARCDSFVGAAESCGNDSAAANELHNECRRAARTWGDDDWDASDDCVVSAQDCAFQMECLNDVFELDPALDSTGSGNSTGSGISTDSGNDIEP